MPSSGATAIWTPSVGGRASSRTQVSSMTVSMAWLSRKTPPFNPSVSLQYPTKAEREKEGERDSQKVVFALTFAC